MTRYQIIFLIVSTLFFIYSVLIHPSPTAPSTTAVTDSEGHSVLDEIGPGSVLTDQIFDTITDNPLHFLNDTVHFTLSERVLRGYMTFSKTKYFDEVDRNTTALFGARNQNGTVTFVAVPRVLLSYVQKGRLGKESDILEAYEVATMQVAALVNHSLPLHPPYLTALFPELIQNRLQEDSVSLVVSALKENCVWLGQVTLLPEKLVITGTLESHTCNVARTRFELSSGPIHERYEAILGYILFTVLFGILHNLSMLSFLNYDVTASHIMHISYFTALWTFAFDFSVLAAHVTFARAYYKASRGLIACGFFHFVLSCMWDSKILSRLNNVHFPNDRSWWFFGRLWFLLVVAMSILNKVRQVVPCLTFIVMYSVWIPQIAYNAIHNTTRGSTPWYVLSTTLTRVWFLLYFFLYERNFAPFETQPVAVAVTVLWCALQCGVLFVQVRLRHPGFFLPVSMRPSTFDYFEGLVDVPRDAECAICQSAIEPNSDRAALAVTPCNHIFHGACLVQWAEVKLVCPICRRPIPPPP